MSLSTLSQNKIKLSYAEITKSMQENSAALSNTLEGRINTIKKCISAHTATIMREQKLAHKNQEKSLRAKNLIVFGMAEQDSLENAVYNLNCFLRHECHIDLELKTTAITRLGPVVQGKNRPIRVTMEDEGKKWEILKRINAARVKGVFARLDLNKEERVRDFALRKELKEMREADPVHAYKIVKNKVVKIQK